MSGWGCISFGVFLILTGLWFILFGSAILAGRL